MSKYNDIKFEQEGDIGILTICRESQLNALNAEVIKEIEQCVQALESKKLSGLILTGEGEKAFIAGADIKAMVGMTAKEAHDFSELGQRVTLLIENLKIPTIAAVNGFALGGGLEFALACDFILASQNAVFALPEVSLGLIPGFGGTQRLAKIIGRNKAKYYIYSGDKIKADKALDMGLVLDVFTSKEELLNQSKQVIQKMQKNSAFAIGKVKSVLNSGVDLPNKAGLTIEAEQFGAIFDSYDMKEGTAAFIEKRKANFKGE